MRAMVVTPAANASVPQQRVKLRLTRRGRIVLGALVTLVLAGVLAAVGLVGASSASASNEQAGQEFGYVVVAPGQTLWNVATELDKSADPRDLVAEIVSLNQLEDSSLQTGQAIAVPLRFSDFEGVVPASEL